MNASPSSDLIASSRDSIGRIGRMLVYGILVVGLLWKGAAIPLPFLTVVVAIAAASVLASFRWPQDRNVRRVAGVILGIALALAGVAFAQSIVLPDIPFANSIWAETNPLLFVTGQAVSVAPTATREAIPTLLAPFFLFTACLAFFPDDRRAMTLLRFLTSLGGLFALFGLVQITMLPHSLLLFEKTHYLDSLTSVFVNRNTAGTFLAVASLTAGIVFVDALRPRRDDLIPQGSGSFGLVLPLRAVPAAIVVALTVTALLLTKSRGAVLSALLGYVVTIPWLAVIARRRLQREDNDATDRPGWHRLLPAVIALLAIGLVASLFGGLTAARLGASATDPGRLCLFRAAAQALSDHPILGTGFATFQDVFPGYRSPTCAESGTAFIRAHNFYLEGLVGFGVPLVPALLGAFWVLGAVLWRGYRTRRRRRFVPVLGVGVIVAAAAHGLVDFSLQIPGMANYLAAVLAAVTTICLGRRRTTRTFRP